MSKTLFDLTYELGPSPTPSRRCFAQRAWAARRSASLRCSGLTLRQRAAPSPTACLLTGEGASFRLAISSISSARSISTSGGRPLWRTMRRRVIVRRTPRQAANSARTAHHARRGRGGKNFTASQKPPRVCGNATYNPRIGFDHR